MWKCNVRPRSGVFAVMTLLKKIGRGLVWGMFLLAGLLKSAAGASPEVREWTVDGVTREALIYRPAGKAAAAGGAPVIFAFHGHGGNMRQAARSFGLHEEWPEAVVIYPQGLKTPGLLTDPEGKRTGWQSVPRAQEGRDLKFFDAMLASLRSEGGIDGKRIYATGHSNGGGFTYLLWAERPEVFAAFAPVAATPSVTAAPMVPKPVIHLAGKTDPLVKFAWQEKTINYVRKLNVCGEGVPWAADASCTFYPSAKGAPVVTFIHDGGHKYPSEAPALIVKFFKETRLP